MSTTFVNRHRAVGGLALEVFGVTSLNVLSAELLVFKGTTGNGQLREGSSVEGPRTPAGSQADPETRLCRPQAVVSTVSTHNPK
jgi:hypothetical protein